MTSKNIIILLTMLAVLAAAYFIFMKKDTAMTADEMTQTDYVGMSTTQAQAQAEANGKMFRVVEIDGQPQPTTRDYREGRINAIVEAGVVTSYTVESVNEQDTSSTTKPEMDDNGAIIGMTVTDAEAYAAENEVDFRVGMRDGEALPVTLDLRPGRITAEVENDVVVGYTVE